MQSRRQRCNVQNAPGGARSHLLGDGPPATRNDVSSRLRRYRARGGAAAIRWLAVLVVLCQGAAWVHAVATPHVTCVEHGESVHLAVRGGQSSAGGQGASALG